MHRATVLALLTVGLLVAGAPSVLAQGEDRGRLVVDATGTTEASPEAPAVVNSSALPGQRYTWELNLTEPSTVLDIVLQDALNITEIHEAVPWLDGQPFREVGFDPAEAQGPARIYNLSGTPNNVTLHLGLPGPGLANLTVEADTVVPRILEVQMVNLTGTWDPARQVPRIVTTTDEPTLGRLVIPREDGDTYEKPTTVPAFEQRFRLTGLKAATTYTYTVEVTDLAGHINATTGTFTTPPAPHRAANVTIQEPTDGAQLTGDTVTVRAQLTDEDGTPLGWGSFNVFLDKRPATEQATRNGSFVQLRATDLAPGDHEVTVEAVTGPGQRVHDTVRFTVVEPTAPAAGPGIALVLLALTTGGVAARWRRSNRPG